jgi:hypothetical protein
MLIAFDRLAALATRVIATGWSAYAIWRTKDIQVRLQGLIFGLETPCHSNLIPTYFRERQKFEVRQRHAIMQKPILMNKGLQIPDLVLNAVALIFFAFFSFRLVKVDLLLSSCQYEFEETHFCRSCIVGIPSNKFARQLTSSGFIG